MIIKPSFLESDIWANGQVLGSGIVNPDNTYKSTGWIFGQKPPYTVANWIQNTHDSMLVHLNQTGIMHWDAGTTYAKNAYVNYLDKVYIAKQANTNHIPVENPYAVTPVTDSYWKLDLPLSSENIVIENNSSPRSLQKNKLVMTNADGLIDITLMDISAMVYKGSVDITLAAPTGLDNGDFYTVQASAVFHTSWGFPVGTDAKAGESLIWDGTKFNILGADVNDNYLLRDGSKPLLGGLQIGATETAGFTSNFYGPLNIGTTANNRTLTVNGNTSISGTLTIAGSTLSETIQDGVAGVIVAGTNIVENYDDTAGTLTIAHSTITRNDTTNSPINATVVNSITTSNGHITAVETKTLTASNIGSTPVGNILANNIQSALEELDTEKVSTNSSQALSSNTNALTYGVGGGGETGVLTLSRADSTTDTVTIFGVNKYPITDDGSNNGKFLTGTITEGAYTWTAPTTYSVFNTSANGLVPGPTALEVSAGNKFLKADGTWSIVSTVGVLSDLTDVGALSPTTGQVLTYSGTEWVASTPAGAVFPTETDFTSDLLSSGNGPSVFNINYTPNQIQLFVSGIKLDSSEYTATNGTSITMTSPLDDGTWLQVVAYENITEVDFTAIQDQTVFNTTYTPGEIVVYVAGIKLRAGIQYTATNGTSITLTTGVDAGTWVQVVKY